MVTFPGTWTTVEFTDAMGRIGWVQRPVKVTWDTTRAYLQQWAWEGPWVNVKAFMVLLVALPTEAVGAQGRRPFQLAYDRNGPNCIVTATWYSNDLDGEIPRDPLTTTWSLIPNTASVPLMQTPKVKYLFHDKSDITTRIIAAAKFFQNSVDAILQYQISLHNAPVLSWTVDSWRNDVFHNHVVCAVDTKGQPIDGTVRDDLKTGGSPDTALIWHASQMYRLLCRNASTVDNVAQYVLRKSQIVFPTGDQSGVSLGSAYGANHWRVGYFFSYCALMMHEYTLQSTAAGIIDFGMLPSYWWLKRPPVCEQTSDSRWQVMTEYWGAEFFEPFNYPYISAPGELPETGAFWPPTWDESPTASAPRLAGTTIYGVRPSPTTPQWTKALQQAIFRNAGDAVDLP